MNGWGESLSWIVSSYYATDKFSPQLATDFTVLFHCLLFIKENKTNRDKQVRSLHCITKNKTHNIHNYDFILQIISIEKKNVKNEIKRIHGTISLHKTESIFYFPSTIKFNTFLIVQLNRNSFTAIKIIFSLSKLVQISLSRFNRSASASAILALRSKL